MDILIIVAVFIPMLAALPETKREKGILDPASAIEKHSDKNSDEIDLRGTIRKHFGMIATLQKLDKSCVCSPLISLLPLGKLILGARGSALKQLYEAIGITVEAQDEDYSDYYYADYLTVTKLLSTLIAELRNVSIPALDVASRIYISKDTKFFKRYEEQSIALFNSTLVKVNFSEQYTLAKKVNDWVSSQTHGNISTIVTPHDFKLSSSIVIVNAIYFSGTWLEPFTKSFQAPFQTRNGVKQVLMMKTARWLSYGFSDKLFAEVLEIPYANDNMSLLLVVPKGVNVLKDLMVRLKSHPEYLTEAVEDMKKHFILLSMPQFRIESAWNLEPIYKEVGLRSIFANYLSGLTGIGRNKEMFITRVVQKAVINIDERGKNICYMRLLTFMTRAINVTVDRPFLFYVKLNSQQLLVGTFYGDTT